MAEFLELIDTIYQEIVIMIALGTGGTVIAYFRGIFNIQKKNNSEISKLRKENWRMKRAFTLQMKLTAKLTRRAHVNEPDIIEDVEEIEKLVNVVLNEDEEED